MAKTDSSEISRKEQKRLEAELRNKKHQATKFLYKEIEKLEEQISSLEDEKKSLLDKLNDEALYSKSEEIVKISVRLKEIENHLQVLYNNWEEKNEELNQILKAFS